MNDPEVVSSLHVAAEGSLRATDVAGTLRRRITASEYAPSARLPSERSLSHEFGVARGTVREALRQLQAAGLLERRAGSGSYVRAVPEAATPLVVDSTSPLQLIDARVALEPEIVRLAVLHGSERGIASLEVPLLEMEACGGDSDVFSPADERFHLALAECAQNPLLVWFAREVSDVRHNAQWAQMGSVTLTPVMITQYNAQHREVFEAIAARSADVAARAMKQHLAKARASLLEVASS